jgi:hypothetical protein
MRVGRTNRREVIAAPTRSSNDAEALTRRFAAITSMPLE